MHRTLAALVLFAVAPVTYSADVKPAAEANNRFAFGLLGQLTSKNQDEAFSPYSIWGALTLTSAGAEAQTLEEMMKVLNLPNEDSIHAMAGDWSKHLTGLKEIDLRVANRLWIKSGLKLTAQFNEIAGKDYGAGAEAIDFSQVSAARLKINAWVADNTNQRIKDLLHPEDLMPATRLVLTNAVYFNAKWLSPFEARGTQKRPFHRETGGDVNVDMMSEMQPTLYAETDWAKVIRLPYRGQQTSMVLVLPREGTKISSMASKLDAGSFAGLLKSMKSVETVVMIPRFQSETRLELADLLGDMGMKRAFTNRAEFGRLTKDEPLKISKVIHQVFVRVAEEGTEAAAATAIVMVPTGAAMHQAKPEEFIADHPFLYFIVDDATGGILFAGTVKAPVWK